jgi:hypothetical protein
MQTDRGQAFEDYQPIVSEDEIRAAYEAGKMVVSFHATPYLDHTGDHIAYLAVKMALYDGLPPVTVLFDRFSAEVLTGYIQTVKNMGWKTDTMKAALGAALSSAKS